MICLLAANYQDAVEYESAHPSLPSHIIVTPENAYRTMEGMTFSRVVYTERFLKVPNQNELYIQARSRCTGSVGASRRKVANSPKG